MRFVGRVGLGFVAALVAVLAGPISVQSQDAGPVHRGGGFGFSFGGGHPWTAAGPFEGEPDVVPTYGLHFDIVGKTWAVGVEVHSTGREVRDSVFTRDGLGLRVRRHFGPSWFATGIVGWAGAEVDGASATGPYLGFGGGRDLAKGPFWVSPMLELRSFRAVDGMNSLSGTVVALACGLRLR